MDTPVLSNCDEVLWLLSACLVCPVVFEFASIVEFLFAIVTFDGALIGSSSYALEEVFSDIVDIDICP